MTSMLIQALGGLAIFIIGMKMMSDGLHHVAGNRMRSILKVFSANRFVAIISGTVVTCVIQSSSASTVMVIGFVNAGLLTLAQAMGLIFGANIGTTITAQVVAFNISWIIMPAIICGLLMSFIPRKKIVDWGETIIGFGFLFFGMKIMSGELKQLADDPLFMQAFQTFRCAPVNGVISPLSLAGAIGIGMLATLIIQSSSACTGIIIALGASGVLDIYTAVALVLGSNIGTTITAQLAAITTNRVAKQTALGHTLFNTIGVLITAGSFWITINGEPVFFKLIKMLSPDNDLPRQIANAHTVFNIATTIILIPFIPHLTKICEKIIPVQHSKVKYQRLEPHLLDTPGIALAQTASALRHMLKKSWKMVDCALNIYNHNDEKNQMAVRKLDKYEAEVDQSQRDITEYLSKLMSKELTTLEASQIPLLLHCTNDAERIGDHTEIICSIMDKLQEDKLRFSVNAENEFESLHQSLRNLAENTVKLLEKKSDEVIHHNLSLIKELNSELDSSETEHISRINNGSCSPNVGILYLELLEEFRKISRHLENINDRAGVFYDRLPNGLKHYKG